MGMRWFVTDLRKITQKVTVSRISGRDLNQWQNFEAKFSDLLRKMTGNRVKYNPSELALIWKAFCQFKGANFYHGESLQRRINTLEGPRTRPSTTGDIFHSWSVWAHTYGADPRWSVPNQHETGFITTRFSRPSCVLMYGHGLGCRSRSTLRQSFESAVQ